MKKIRILSAVLLLLIVSIVSAGLLSDAKSYYDNRVTGKVTKSTTEGGKLPETLTFPSCEIVSTVTNDIFDYYHGAQGYYLRTGKEVCAKKKLVCGGAYALIEYRYLDSLDSHSGRGLVQAVSTTPLWLDKSFCSKSLGMVAETEHLNYGTSHGYTTAREPYFGAVLREVTYQAFLCCK